MNEKTPIRYIILPVIAVALAAAILVLQNIHLPISGDKPGPGTTAGAEEPTGTPTGSESDANGIFAYEVTDGKATVIGFAETFEDAWKLGGDSINYPCFSQGRLTIPAKIDGNPVVAIGSNAFQNDSRIKSLVISEGITAIMDYAFDGCDAISSISFPKGLKSIDECAFFGCSSLEKLVLPSSLKTLASYAFRSCDGLKEITTPITAGFDEIFESDIVEKLTICEGATAIAEDAFYMCAELTEVSLPEGLTSIKNYAFAECPKLSSINFPASLLSIGENAFENDEALTEIKLPEGLTLISEYAFNGCMGLTKVYLPDSIVTIGACAFDLCDNVNLSVSSGSEAMNYAERNEINYTIR